MRITQTARTQPIADEGTVIGSAQRINFIGTGVTAAVNPSNADQIDVTISASVTDVLAALAASAAAKDMGGGNITNVGTVDGIDISVAAIASAAHVAAAFPHTGTLAQLNTAVTDRDLEADATKLDGIEALADVTDEANVLAGASISATAGETLVAGNLVTFNNSGGAAKLFKCDADGATPLNDCSGICTTGGSADATVKFRACLVSTDIPDSLFDQALVAGDVGKRAYMSETAGNLTIDVSGFTSGSMALHIGTLSQVGTNTNKIIIDIGEGYTVA